MYCIWFGSYSFGALESTNIRAFKSTKACIRMGLRPTSGTHTNYIRKLDCNIFFGLNLQTILFTLRYF